MFMKHAMLSCSLALFAVLPHHALATTPDDEMEIEQGSPQSSSFMDHLWGGQGEHAKVSR
jgi:hypothetical protein